ncbi:mitochondrial import inner membrane translocase subunit Tim54 [Pisolithus thermaeus]|nr:mitochondrial import inner membrane translocase subunit Tim54 [Pisolithus thermaeus]
MDKPDAKSGIRAALKYTGIPQSWLSARPRLPSRNWLIFITLTSSVLSYYTYDRHQARKIRASYIDRVKHFSEEPMKSSELPRKVTVYGAKWPGDEDHQRAIRFFKKYVKPVLVAAAVDYDVIPTRQLGDLTRHVASSVVTQRRIALGIDQPPAPPLNLSNQLSEEQKRARELEGGVILVGRHSLKEYLEGLVRGWTCGLENVDREERLAQELAADGTFDEVDEGKSPVGVVDDPEVEPIPTSSRLPPSRNAALLPPLGFYKPPPVSDVTSKLLVASVNPPSTLPPQPPLLLVPFTNHIGFRYIPHMIWSFFNERDRVRAGAEAAYALVIGQTRDFRGPNSWHSEDAPLQETPKSTEGEAASGTLDSMQGGDLDFMLWSEKFFAPHSPLSSISDARKSYYSSLPSRLTAARQLARGECEMTKEEEKNPPASEVELRAERLTKESKWRAQEEGWNIVRPGMGVRWDERFRGVLKVFKLPEEGGSTGTGVA